MSHTEGPLEVVQELRANDEIVCDMLNCGYVIPSRGQRIGEWRDDATLISAAPDLLEALEAMCEEFRGHDLPYGSAAYQKAISAINKARSAS